MLLLRRDLRASARRVKRLFVFQKLRRAWHSARALQMFARKDAAAALRSIDAMNSIKPLNDAERMWTYFPLAMAGRFDEAFDVLDDVCRTTETPADDDGRFINLCARALRASSHNDHPLKHQFTRQAKELKPRSSIRMWSQFDGTDIR